MENNRYFQWVVGDRKGEVVVLNEIIEDDGDVFLEFKDESRINVEFVAELNQRDLSGKMMAEVDSPSNIWRFKEIEKDGDKPRVVQDWESQQKYEVPTADEIAAADLTSSGGQTRPVKRKKQIELIPPKKTPKLNTKFGKVNSVETVEQVQHVQPNPDHSNDPVWVMMDKAKKFDTIVPMELTISLPSKSLYDVAKESFEDGGKKVIDFIIENLDDKKLKDSLREALAESYEDVEEVKEKPKQYIKKEEAFSDIGSTIFQPEVVEEPVIGKQTLEKDNKINPE